MTSSEEQEILGAARTICAREGMLLRLIAEVPGGGCIVIVAVPSLEELNTARVRNARDDLERIPGVKGVQVELAAAEV